MMLAVTSRVSTRSSIIVPTSAGVRPGGASDGPAVAGDVPVKFVVMLLRIDGAADGVADVVCDFAIFQSICSANLDDHVAIAPRDGIVVRLAGSVGDGAHVEAYVKVGARAMI